MKKNDRLIYTLLIFVLFYNDTIGQRFKYFSHPIINGVNDQFISTRDYFIGNNYYSRGGDKDDVSWLIGDFFSDEKNIEEIIRIDGRYEDNDPEKKAVVNSFKYEHNDIWPISKQTLAEYWDTQKWLTGDFNGDGKDDLVNIYKAFRDDNFTSNKNYRSIMWMHFSEGSEFQYYSGLQTLYRFYDDYTWVSGDINGNDKDDLTYFFSQIYTPPAERNSNDTITYNAGRNNSDRQDTTRNDSGNRNNNIADCTNGNGGTSYTLRNDTDETRYVYVNGTGLNHYVRSLNPRETMVLTANCRELGYIYVKEEYTDTFRAVKQVRSVLGDCCENRTSYTIQILF